MRKLKKLCNIVTAVLVSAIVLLAVLLGGVRLFNVTPYTVLSGSMEPTYHVGSVVYVKKVDPFTLKEKDVITFVVDGGTVITHRIVEVLYDDEENPTQVFFRTQGDNNNIEDLGDPIAARQVLGKVVFTIPLLGYVADFVQNPPGRSITLGICVCLAALFFLPDILSKLFKDDEDENDGEANETDGASESDKEENDGAENSLHGKTEDPSDGRTE